MMLACTLSEPGLGLPTGNQVMLSVLSQQNLLTKFSKKVTGVITLEDGKPLLSVDKCRLMFALALNELKPGPAPAARP